MCNLYAMTASRDEVRRLFGAAHDRTGNQPPLPGIFPDTTAPVIRQGGAGREIVGMRWGLPSPKGALKGRRTDPGVTNVRNAGSPHWRRWLGTAHRCLVPFTSFSEYDRGGGGGAVPVWFALDETRPPACFAGLWTRWTSVRKLKDGETTDDLFAFLTTEANAVVAPIHSKAMPVILTGPEEWSAWLDAPAEEALRLQRPLPPERLTIVARGTREDG